MAYRAVVEAARRASFSIAAGGQGHVYDLKSLHTKVLMRYMEKARACGGSYDPTENWGTHIPIADIKAELDTREHVPNKAEAKKLRQQKAKQKRSR